MEKKYTFKKLQKYIAEILGVDLKIIKRSSFFDPSSNIMGLSLTDKLEEMPEGHKGSSLCLALDQFGRIFTFHYLLSDKLVIEGIKNGGSEDVVELSAEELRQMCARIRERNKPLDF